MRETNRIIQSAIDKLGPLDPLDHVASQSKFAIYFQKRHHKAQSVFTGVFLDKRHVLDDDSFAKVERVRKLKPRTSKELVKPASRDGTSVVVVMAKRIILPIRGGKKKIRSRIQPRETRPGGGPPSHHSQNNCPLR